MTSGALSSANLPRVETWDRHCPLADCALPPDRCLRDRLWHVGPTRRSAFLGNLNASAPTSRFAHDLPQMTNSRQLPRMRVWPAPHLRIRGYGVPRTSRPDIIGPRCFVGRGLLLSHRNSWQNVCSTPRRQQGGQCNQYEQERRD